MNLTEQIKVLTLEYTDLNRENQKLRAKMANLEQKIKSLKKKQAEDMPSVTDHAILRLAERKYGLKIEDLKEEILSEPVRNAIKMGAKRIRHNGMEFVLNDGLVVTVLN